MSKNNSIHNDELFNEYLRKVTHQAEQYTLLVNAIRSVYGVALHRRQGDEIVQVGLPDCTHKRYHSFYEALLEIELVKRKIEDD